MCDQGNLGRKIRTCELNLINLTTLVVSFITDVIGDFLGVTNATSYQNS